MNEVVFKKQVLSHFDRGYFRKKWV